MRPSEFVSKYILHDSYIESVANDQAEHTVTLRIHFAFWMQEDYQDGSPETGILIVTFHNVHQYQCEGGNPAGSFVGILGAECDGDCITINLLDDETVECFNMTIAADDVTVVVG